MPLTPPFTREEFLSAVPGAFAMPENTPRQREKPRASAISGCARENAYMMANVPASEEQSTDGVLTNEQGRMFEDLSIHIIESIPDRHLLVRNRQMCIGHEACSDEHEQGPDSPVTGHPDGMLWFPSMWDDDGNPVNWYPNDGDGLTWGFEHKHVGRYKYEDIVKRGSVYAASPEYVVQSLMYGSALEWDAVAYVIVSQDASSIRGDATANLRAKRPEVRWAAKADYHPKVTIEFVDLRPLYGTLGESAYARAEWLAKWYERDGNPANVRREYDPEDLSKQNWRVGDDGEPYSEYGPQFPCSYCPWYRKCVEDGEGTEDAPGLPFTL